MDHQYIKHEVNIHRHTLRELLMDILQGKNELVGQQCDCGYIPDVYILDFSGMPKVIPVLEKANFRKTFMEPNGTIVNFTEEQEAQSITCKQLKELTHGTEILSQPDIKTVQCY